MKEIKYIPADRLEKLYQYIHTLNPKHNPSISLRKKILSFGGAFGDMKSSDYADFIKTTKKQEPDILIGRIPDEARYA
jgi:hypothetical protein